MVNDSVRTFWQWFGENADLLKTLYSGEQYGRLAEQVNRALDRVNPGLAWEVGAGQTKPYLLTISAEGNPELRDIAELMVQQAPPLEEWEFHSSRPASLAPKRVQLQERSESFDTSSWSFVPVERPEQGRLDLVIVDDELAASDRESAMKAVSIYLDQILGEDAVESWIGRFSLESRGAAHGKKILKLEELPDYLLWATHRESKPLKKTGGH